MSIASNLLSIEERIQNACVRAGRKREDVVLVGVSKKKPASAVVEALETTALRDFGENYIQEYVEKRGELANHPDAVWHLIGHIQRNKVRQLMAYPPALIHSVDSVALAEQLERVTAELYPERRQPILIELRIGDEDGEKTGLGLVELDSMLEKVEQCAHLDLQGLMLIPPASDDAEDARPYFQQVHKIFDNINEKRTKKMTILSYGMSHDFEIAIEEGATHIRVGTAIFGARA